MTQTTDTIHELASLRNRPRVFADRRYAGEVLAQMLESYRDTDTLVLGIPAGGLPVAAEIARRLALHLDVVVVSKITLPWNSESGFGAIAFDGTVRLNEALLPHFGLTKHDVDRGIERTAAKVMRRGQRLRGQRPLPRLTNRHVIVVDDGLASGFTMQVAVEALRRAGADHLIIAVPTAHARAAERLVCDATALYCPNIREGRCFAVADAYEHWWDLDEEEASRILASFDEEIPIATTPA